MGKTSDKTKLGVTGDLVMRLCEHLPHHENFKLFFDNYFTSLALIKELYSIGILSLGTIRGKRLMGAQTLLLSEKCLKTMGRGSYDWRVDASFNISVIKWQDNSVIQLASLFIGTSIGGKVKRWSSKDKKTIEIDCPSIVHEYNKFMGAVDLHDMLLSLYAIKLRSNKWYMPIFYYCIKVAVTNFVTVLVPNC